MKYDQCDVPQEFTCNTLHTSLCENIIFSPVLWGKKRKVFGREGHKAHVKSKEIPPIPPLMLNCVYTTYNWIAIRFNRAIINLVHFNVCNLPNTNEHFSNCACHLETLLDLCK